MEREIIQTSDGSSTNFSIKKENFEELSADS